MSKKTILLCVAAAAIVASLAYYYLKNKEPYIPYTGTEFLLQHNLKPYVLNYNREDNHLNIKVDKNPANNYYMVIGDWGGSNVGNHKNQQAVADMMLRYYNDNLDKKLLFIVTLGDNFYFHGQNGKTWDKNWYNVYDKKLTSVPWFPVMGNHDWGNDDPWCLCPEGNPNAKKVGENSYHCNALNSDKGIKRPAHTSNYYFPDFCYHYSINELNFELIAVSADYIDAPKAIGGNGITKGKGAYQTNRNCEKAGIDLVSKLKTIYEAGVNLVEERGRTSKNKNILITNHYPSSKFGGHSPKHTDLKTFFEDASKSKSQTIISAGGHIHSIGCKQMKGKTCVEMLSGGGGGCCSKDPVDKASGFFAVHFDSDKNMVTKQVSYPYHVSAQKAFANEEPLDVPHPPDDPNDEYGHHTEFFEWDSYLYDEGKHQGSRKRQEGREINRFDRGIDRIFDNTNYSYLSSLY